MSADAERNMTASLTTGRDGRQQRTGQVGCRSRQTAKATVKRCVRRGEVAPAAVTVLRNVCIHTQSTTRIADALRADALRGCAAEGVQLNGIGGRKRQEEAGRRRRSVGAG